MGVDGEFHGYGQVVGAVHQGVEDGSRHGVVAILVDALVEVLSVIADSLIGVAHITHAVVAKSDFVGHEDEVETVVEATARAAVVVGPVQGGLGVIGRILTVFVPFAYARATQRVDETNVFGVIGLGEQFVAAFVGGIHVEVAHNQHIIGGIMLVDIVHGGLQAGAARALIAHASLEVSHDADELDGVASGQTSGLHVKLIDVGVARVGAQGDMALQTHLARVEKDMVDDVAVGVVEAVVRLPPVHTVDVQVVAQEVVLQGVSGAKFVDGQNVRLYIIQYSADAFVLELCVVVGLEARGETAVVIAVFEEVVLHHREDVLCFRQGRDKEKNEQNVCGFAFHFGRILQQN